MYVYIYIYIHVYIYIYIYICISVVLHSLAAWSTKNPSDARSGARRLSFDAGGFLIGWRPIPVPVKKTLLLKIIDSER